MDNINWHIQNNAEVLALVESSLDGLLAVEAEK